MQEHDLPRTLAFHPGTRSVVYFGRFRLDLSDGLLTCNGEEVRLPPRALTILQHLVERAGRIVSKQSLMDVAWKDAHVSETSLTEAVGLIRQAPEKDDLGMCEDRDRVAADDLAADRRSVFMVEADSGSGSADADERGPQLGVRARPARPVNPYGNLRDSAGGPEDFRPSCGAS